MKKLLAVLLSAVLVLGLSAVSMAAVTVGGEFNIGYKLDEVNVDKIDADEEGYDWNESKVTVTGDINDNLAVFAAIKVNTDGGDFSFFNDELWAQLKYDTVSVKAGYFGLGFGGPKDILDAASGDFKADAGVLVEATLSEGLVGKLYYAYDNSLKSYTKNVLEDEDTGDLYLDVEPAFLDAWIGDGAFAVGLDYTLDALSLGFLYGSPALEMGDYYEEKSVMAVSAAYTMDAFKAYVNYSTRSITDANDKDLDNTNIIIGGMYDSADVPFYARVEYDLDNENEIANWADEYNLMGIRVGYKLNSNAMIEYQTKQVVKVIDNKEDAYNDAYLKLKVVF